MSKNRLRLSLSPLPVPLVLQRKTKKAAPVYRPQPVPKVLQRRANLHSPVLQAKPGPNGISAGNVIQRMAVGRVDLELVTASVMANPEIDGHAKALLRGGFLEVVRLSGPRNENAILEEKREASFSGTRRHAYYRALSREEFPHLVTANQLPAGSGYQGLSPSREYCEGYLGDNPYLVQFLCDENVWTDIMER